MVKNLPRAVELPAGPGKVLSNLTQTARGQVRAGSVTTKLEPRGRFNHSHSFAYGELGAAALHKKDQQQRDRSVPLDVSELEEWDRRGLHNMQECAIYAKEIAEWLVAKEASHRPRTGYMDSQPDINEKMRRILFDWLIEVHYKFKLRPQSLYLTQNVIDRFLSVHTVERQKLQLIGISSLFIASKYEEIYAPEVGDLSYITDYAYKKKEILDMEGTILSKLQFDVTVTYAYELMHRWGKIARCSKKLMALAEMMLDCSVLDYDLSVNELPSKIAAAALYLSLNLEAGHRKEAAWSSKNPAYEALRTHTKYPEEVLRPVAK